MPLRISGRAAAILGMLAVAAAIIIGLGLESTRTDHHSMEFHIGEGSVMPTEGQPLPAFEFTDVDGRPISSATLLGKVLVVDVWASWCEPCKTEMPAFEQLHQQYREKGLAIIGISIDITAEDAARFAREIGVTYPIVHHPEIMTDWGLLGLPTTLIVDRAGIVRGKIVGFEYKDAFEKSLRELL
ncbi:MAG: TlpA family protein disulfide reductase [Acidobacteria bacterium]|nr:TlpA family protein disulfide reductase [Acidobacteriota bacterium]